MTEKQLRETFPEIKWDEPVKVMVVGTGERWACRLCVATIGLRASEIDRTPFAYRTRAEAEEHLREHTV